MSTAAVVGGGISGLVAAHRLISTRPGTAVTVYEASDRLGGCLRGSDLNGHAPAGADVGAEASLYVRPETVGLCRELGLELEFPSRAHSSRIHAHGAMHAIPAGTLMGVPADPQALAGLLTESEIVRVSEEQLTAPAAGDVSVGGFLAARLGDALVDTVVDPLLGGVYAGRCRDLSLAATIPALLPAARAGTPVLDAVAEVLRARAAGRAATPGANVPGSQPAEAPPVFMSLRGGMNRLVTALAEHLGQSGVEFRLGAPVRAVRQAGGGTWAVESVSGGVEEFDALVLAVPAHAATGLLAGVDAEIAGIIGGVDHASSAVVTVVIDVAEAPLEGSGFLVPPTETAFIKASTYASNKWPWLAALLPADTAVVRMSVGRFGDDPDAWEPLPDEELAARAIADWRRITGRAAPVLHSEVQRWTAALPQYTPGHLERTARIDAVLAGIPGLALVGSAYDGVGIPACIARAEKEIARLTGGPPP
ncbi:protoporphyrinogen oxidase [uncultured Brevibacterium sp.]|uniref:protoporphyrinogen oxidase n=1 Tax=uncultured Brevibacterium sp. TaxID=189678 RepID=UPI0025E5C1AD|nr:protoporphyrinogen oxidase [uncultured Brevibacterium sp.]